MELKGTEFTLKINDVDKLIKVLYESCIDSKVACTLLRNSIKDRISPYQLACGKKWTLKEEYKLSNQSEELKKNIKENIFNLHEMTAKQEPLAMCFMWREDNKSVTKTVYGSLLEFKNLMNG